MKIMLLFLGYKYHLFRSILSHVYHWVEDLVFLNDLLGTEAAKQRDKFIVVIAYVEIAVFKCYLH